MNIHEYQARELFGKFNVATQPGSVAGTPEEAEQIATKLGTKELIVKAQIHAGGRGKGTFKSGFKGGVHVCSSPAEARDLAGKMLGQVLVTHQTGAEGKQVNKVFVGEAVEIGRELYFAILHDRATSGYTIIASTEGGVNIEEVAEHTPEKIVKVSINPALGLQAYQSRNLAAALKLTGPLMNQAVKLFGNLFALFLKCDCSMVEVNPLVVTKDGRLMALDAKFNFDDNALYRQPEVVAMRDKTEEDPREVAASEFNLNYIGLDGNIACLVNGAGLAMATMDIIQHYGGSPANFLDVGGGASKDQVTAAFKIILGDPNVKGILVNIFGGIMDCNVIATGIVAAAKEVAIKIPLVVRLEGNNVAAGKQTLAESGLALITGDTLDDAAQKVVAAVGK
ncbi:MAG: ADP-forming succinate--CoA ligase subunit beta [Verrucomicrobiota bacterium]|jgi:succinyl-CoA synthetase beta subunit